MNCPPSCFDGIWIWWASSRPRVTYPPKGGYTSREHVRELGSLGHPHVVTSRGHVEASREALQTSLQSLEAKVNWVNVRQPPIVGQSSIQVPQSLCRVHSNSYRPSRKCPRSADPTLPRSFTIEQ
jgi:hypothetical protein